MNEFKKGLIVPKSEEIKNNTSDKKVKRIII